MTLVTRHTALSDVRCRNIFVLTETGYVRSHLHLLHVILEEWRIDRVVHPFGRRLLVLSREDE